MLNKIVRASVVVVVAFRLAQRSAQVAGQETLRRQGESLWTAEFAMAVVDDAHSHAAASLAAVGIAGALGAE